MTLRWAALLEAAAVVAAGIYCLVFQLWLPSTHVAEADYQQVAQVLAQEAQPNDAVLLYPWWTERARMFVPPNLEVIGFQGSDGDDLELHGRIWLLAEPKQPKADLDAFLKSFGVDRTALGPPRTFGNLTLQPFANHRARAITFSAGERLAQAKVYLEDPQGQQQACSFDGKAHHCGNSLVTLEWREEKFQPRHCIRFFPTGGANKLVLQLDGLPASQMLGLRTGMTWDRGWFHHAGLTPTEVDLKVGDQQVGTVTIPPGLEGVQRVDGPSIPEGATVKVTAQSTNPELRELCVELYGFGAKQ